MKSIEEIISSNKKAAARSKASAPVEHCRYSGTIDDGIVLYSAKQKKTRTLRYGAAHVFVNAWMDIPARLLIRHRAVSQLTAAARDALVESYF